MNEPTQDQTPQAPTNSLPDSLTPPAEAQTEAKKTETQSSPDSPAPENFAAYEAAVRDLRRAKMPETVIDGMSSDDILAWHQEYAPVQAGIDQTFQKAATLQKELDGLRDQATPREPKQAQIDFKDLGFDEKQAQAIQKIVADAVAPLKEGIQTSQETQNQHALEVQFDAMQEATPELKDPRIRLKVQEKAVQLFGAYGDPKAALLDAVRLVVGQGGGDNNQSKQRGQPGMGRSAAGSPQSPNDELLSLAREITRKER